MDAYYDARFACEALRLLPGEYAAVPPGRLLTTTLGSCVTACMRDETAGIAGMNHFMLPEAGVESALSYAGRYGAYAMELLVNALLSRGARRDRIAVKLFGGAAVLRLGANARDIGRDNANFALTYLKTEGLRLVASDLGGTAPRQLYFFTGSGEVRVRYLRRSCVDAIAAVERAHVRDVRASSVGGVELWGT